MNEATVGELPRKRTSSLQCQGNLLAGQWRDMHGDQPVAQIGVIAQGSCGAPLDARVLDIDGIRDHGRGCIRLGRCPCEHGDAVGDPQRMAATSPAAGRNAAHRGVMADFQLTVQRQVVGGGGPDRLCQVAHQANLDLGLWGQVEGDIATVIDPGPGDARTLVAVDEFFGNGTGNRCHRRDESGFARIGEGDAGLPHPSCDWPLQAIPRSDAACVTGPQRNACAQQSQLLHQGLQQWFKARPGGLVCGLYCARIPVGRDDEIDGAVLEMPAPAVEPLALRGHAFDRCHWG